LKVKNSLHDFEKDENAKFLRQIVPLTAAAWLQLTDTNVHYLQDTPVKKEAFLPCRGGTANFRA
jgi:hypothetical protein